MVLCGHGKVGNRLAEEVVTGHYQKILMGDVLRLDDMVNIADCTQLIGVAGGSVVDDREFESRMSRLVIGRPLLERGGKFVIGDHIDSVDIGNRGEIVQNPLDHRLAGDIEEWFCFVFRQWVEASGIPGGKNEDVHKMEWLLLMQPV